MELSSVPFHLGVLRRFRSLSVEITVPDQFIVGATGRRTAERKNPDGTRTLTYVQEDVHDFAWTACPDFVEFRERFTLADPAVDTEMIFLVHKAHLGSKERYVRSLRQGLEFYSRHYGPYPYGTITLVDPAPGATAAGGMEYPTLFTSMTTSYMPAGVRLPEMVTIHEFGHGYWYGIVGSNEFEEAWLDEGINSYSEAKAMAQYYGPEGSLIDFGALRVSDIQYQRFSVIGSGRFDPILRNSWEYLSGGSYSLNVYSKASLMLLTLERVLGEETMAKVMKTYYERWKFRHPTSADFVQAAEDASGRDLKWFFDQALHSPDKLDYAIGSLASEEAAPEAGYFNGKLVTPPAAQGQGPGGHLPQRGRRRPQRGMDRAPGHPDRAGRGADDPGNLGRPGALEEVRFLRTAQARLRPGRSRQPLAPGCGFFQQFHALAGPARRPAQAGPEACRLVPAPPVPGRPFEEPPMKILRSYTKGIRDALLRPKAAVLLWLVNAAFAAVFYFVACGAVTQALGRSLAADDLLARSNVDALFELLTGNAAALSALIVVGLLMLLLYLIVSPLLFGGILFDLVHPRENPGGFAQTFWAGAGRYYGRFFRLIPASLVLWLPAAALFLLVDRLLDVVGRDPLKEQLGFTLTFVRVAAALFLFFLVRMIMDYARIRIAAAESRSALGATAWAAVFVLRRLGGTLALYYMLGLTALAGFAAYLGVQSLFAKTTSAAVLAGFLLTQLHILWRSWIKVAYQGAELGYYLQSSK